MLRERIGAPRPPSERVDYERNVGIARAALGEAAFAAAWEAGRKQSLDAAVWTARELIG